MKHLSPELVALLARKTSKKTSTIHKDISILSRTYSALTRNAVAQIYALQNGTSVLRFLDDDDRRSLPPLTVEKQLPKVVIKSGKPAKKIRIVQFLQTKSNEFYKVDHVVEINRCYTFRCYTACFVLCRKVIENTIIDILRKRFPPSDGDNLGLYYDSSQRRYKDFSVLLKNLERMAAEFGPDHVLVERIVQIATPFKKDANDKAHSWYHIVKNQEELDKLHVQDMLGLLEELLYKMKTV